MSRLSSKDLRKKIEYHIKEIAKHRDALRKLCSDAKEIEESADEALRSLQDAVDTLSQYL